MGRVGGGSPDLRVCLVRVRELEAVPWSGVDERFCALGVVLLDGRAGRVGG
jgi:hypothetical protein